MRILLVTLLVIGILLLGACGGTSPEPAPTPDTTAAPAPADELAPAPPPEPEPTPAPEPAKQEELPNYILSISIDPSEAGSVSPSGGEYKSGESVELKAIPAGGYAFERWSGDASGTSSTVKITMNSAKSIVAHFSAIDATPPVISDLDISDITESSAAINWVTDEPATGQVEYGTTGAYGSITPLNKDMDTSHSITLTGLKPDTTYHFRLISVDEAGNEAQTSDNTFSTKTLEELVTAKIDYPPTLFPGLTQNGKQIIADSYTLTFELYNGSSQTITINRVQVVDGPGREQISFGIDPNTVDAGKTQSLMYIFENEPLEDWQVKWYCVDANGAEFTVIGVCISD